MEKEIRERVENFIKLINVYCLLIVYLKLLEEHKDSKVVAAARKANEEGGSLKELSKRFSPDRLTLITLDISDASSVKVYFDYLSLSLSLFPNLF